ncbi:hypothetical protein GCM10022214_09710 [Actinomadura miaoliensis]|uniref:GNAT family N-acetyltransferase n=1 Tax=Actinomadura miaoliensis TaxID=430685 RepID=A0ABP7V4A7_9ACTN
MAAGVRCGTGARAVRGGREPALYSWDVQGYRLSVGGVTDDRKAAFRYVDAALRSAPGVARGAVWRVALSLSGQPVYDRLGAVGWAWRDEVIGVVAWFEP